MREVAATTTRKARSDAAANHEHIMITARNAFARDGLDLPVREVARRCGVGVATVYRHFPSRRDLVSAVLEEQVRACEAQMQAALDDEDPVRALVTCIRRFGERQVLDRGLNEALLGPQPHGGAFVETRRAHAEAFARLVDRARAAGALREEITVEDVRVGLTALASFRALPSERATVAVRRLTDLLLVAILVQPPTRVRDAPATGPAVGRGRAGGSRPAQGRAGSGVIRSS